MSRCAIRRLKHIEPVDLDRQPAVLMVELFVVLDQLLGEENLLLPKVLAAPGSPEEQGVEGGGEGEQVLPGQAGGLLLPLADAQHLVLEGNRNNVRAYCGIDPDVRALDSPIIRGFLQW